MATSQETLAKWKEEGFEPTDRALEADKFIDSRNPQDHPDEFTWVGSMGYVYTGPARYYTTGSEHTAWLNSKLSQNPYETAYDVARVIDNQPVIPKGNGLFAPLESYEPSSRTPPMGQQMSGLSAEKYLTQAELDAYNQQNGTQFSGLKLGRHPETGESGMFSWDPLFGWRDDTKWLGPRTHYEDGTPINLTGASFRAKMDALKNQPASVVRDALPSMPAQTADSPEYTALNPMTGMLLGIMPPSFQRNFLAKRF